MSRLKRALHDFFFPPPGARLSVRLLPYVTLGALTLTVIAGGAYAWDYTNSPEFCGAVCHTMPPEYSAYLVSPHARVYCVDCHIGRGFIATRVTRKAGDIKHIISLAFKKYEFPIVARELRPARETCERCHFPEKFSDDSLREIRHFGDDAANTPTSIYLVMKTGGGSKRQGLGRGIHWHIENRVLYYSTDPEEQHIPYIRVYNDDGSITEYVDLEAQIDPASIPEAALKEMDCITCHNRITHRIYTPEDSIDMALARKVIDPAIPEIRRKGVEVLRATYTSQGEALASIAALEAYYRSTYPDYYAANSEKVRAAIAAVQDIYLRSVFPEQKADWTTHPNNIGHKDSPGCFRCHDGKHLNVKQEAVRLECNLCHSIPIVVGAERFAAQIEISRGPEPQSHLNPNWIAMHRTYFDQTCSLCHTTTNPGGTDNSSFCSNSACHGVGWKYAGLDAPALAAVIAAQLPTPMPTPTPAPVIGGPTYTANIQPIFQARCGACHGDSKAGGLKLTTYADALAGSAQGAVIVPGDSQGSKLIEVQSGQHFANLTAEELKLVVEWIDAGAPQ